MIDVIIIENDNWIYGSIFVSHILYVQAHKYGMENRSIIFMCNGSKIITTDTIQALRNKIALLTT